jgi:hypothetical protein
VLRFHASELKFNLFESSHPVAPNAGAKKGRKIGEEIENDAHGPEDPVNRAGQDFLFEPRLSKPS